MSRRTLFVDIAIAALLALLVVILSPGLAVAGLVAILVLIVCAISLAVDALRKRIRMAGNRSRRSSAPPARRRPRV